MKLKVIAVGLLAAALSAMTASAHLLITVDCCNGATPVDLSGIVVTATQVGGSEVETGTTDVNGFVQLSFINIGDFTVCVDTTTLPAGATLATPCQVGTVPLTPLANSLTFCLSGTICTGAPGLCWETGGGTLDKGKKGDNVWSFGGVIYPGCSSQAAGGGNLNIVNHITGLHFKGTDFIVDGCRGIPTKSPKVTVNIIDWHGTGYVSGDDESKKTSVMFVGTFRDAKDSGSGADGLYIQVTDLSGNPVFQIGNGPDDLDLLTTGNVQIHQSSCGKGKP